MNNIGKLETRFDYLAYFEICKMGDNVIDELSIMQLYLLFLTNKYSIVIKVGKKKKSYKKKNELLTKCRKYHTKTQFYIFLNALYVYRSNSNIINTEAHSNEEFFKSYTDNEIIKGINYAF